MEIGEQEGVAVCLHALDVERLVEFQESHRAIILCQCLTELCAALPVSGDDPVGLFFDLCEFTVVPREKTVSAVIRCEFPEGSEVFGEEMLILSGGDDDGNKAEDHLVGAEE